MEILKLDTIGYSVDRFLKEYDYLKESGMSEKEIAQKMTKGSVILLREAHTSAKLQARWMLIGEINKWKEQGLNNAQIAKLCDISESTLLAIM